MSYLFVVTGRAVFPNPEALLINPFKKIWNRDKDPEKTTALDEFTYIEFMISKKKSNPFAGYKDSVRSAKIIEKTGMDKKFKPDKYVLEGIKFIKTLQVEASPSYRYLQNALIIAEKTGEYLKDIDPGEVNPKSQNLMLKPADIAKATKEVPEAIKKLKEWEKKVHDELIEDSQVRGKKKISYFSKRESFLNVEE